MLRGQLKASQQHALLSSHDDLAQALEGAFFVQVKGDISPTNVSVCQSKIRKQARLCQFESKLKSFQFCNDFFEHDVLELR